jgi:hypothetical protein
MAKLPSKKITLKYNLKQNRTRVGTHLPSVWGTFLILIYFSVSLDIIMVSFFSFTSISSVESGIRVREFLEII